MLKDFIERFREAIRVKTDWPGNAHAGDIAAESPLIQFQDFLVKSYPDFHNITKRWTLSPYSVIYHWPCSGTGAEKTGKADSLPVLLLGHYDVVPAETAKWSVDPFGAELKDSYIYGRGALDMKSMVMAIMESAEILCRRGFRPSRDIWIALGGDEERTGVLGAKETAKWFSDKGIQFSFILDEGTPIAKDQIKGIDIPLALIGIEEKGYISLDLTVEQKPGHASQPPEEQAPAILARALLRLSRRPFPWQLSLTIEAFFKQLGFLIPGISGFVMRHARLLGPLFYKAAAVNPATQSLLRTTLAMTQLEGSAADNVLPSAARAVINIRLLSPWNVDTGTRRVKAVIADERVCVTAHGLGTNPVEAGPGEASQKSPGWREIKTALEKTIAGVEVLPFLMMATTDSRHYKELSRYIFRFSPQLLDPEEIARIHGHDERISLENLENCLNFYSALMEHL